MQNSESVSQAGESLINAVSWQFMDTWGEFGSFLSRPYCHILTNMTRTSFP